MGHHPETVSQPRKPSRRLLFFGFLGVVAAVLLGRPLLDMVRKRPIAPPLLEVRPRTSAEEVAKPHLVRAEQEAQRVIEEQVKSIDTFFADAKKGTASFAAEALGWGSKWRLMADYVPYTEKDRHQKFMREKFEEHVFKADHLEETVKQVVRSYLNEIRSIESKMLVDLRADVADLPTTYPLAQLDDKRLQEIYDLALKRAAAATGGNLQADVARELGSLIAGEVLTQVAVRLGISAGILGAGATTSWATLGISLALSIIVDAVVKWAWDWWSDPKGNLAAELDKKLDETNRLIVDGSSDVQGLRDRLKQFARDRAVLRRSAVLEIMGGAK